MVSNCDAFSSFSTNDMNKAKEFYGEVLGLKYNENRLGLLELDPEHCSVLIYPKEDHMPADFTVLNFYVTDIEKQVEELSQKGVEFEKYDGKIKTNEKGIHRGIDTPAIAWFKDPAGNILSLIEQKN
ncbi:VOC family protein [Pontixanthobacter gangjinensis]|uniref:VOC family protein n=1 Tax=Christiangramia aestuarii TaxID=1028746 RepID=A0A7K1LPU1_9FLAO|nr:VOC family protein [Christiangramia aestuarii]MUP42773.1 VOC family protein [Christiangramia aestuarii]